MPMTCTAQTSQRHETDIIEKITDRANAPYMLECIDGSLRFLQHEYFAGCALLAEWLRQTPGVWPVLVAEGWPKNEAIFKDAKAVVVYADGGIKLPFLEQSKWDRMKELIKAGTGLVMLHQAVDVPEERSEEVRSWIGGVWQKDIGCRGHWDMEFKTIPAHEVTRGVTPFAAPGDGWLYNMHFAEKGVIARR
jgi:hypothetical protein